MEKKIQNKKNEECESNCKKKYLCLKQNCKKQHLIKINLRNDEDLRNFKNSEEYNEIMVLLIEDEKLKQDQNDSQKQNENLKQNNKKSEKQNESIKEEKIKNKRTNQYLDDEHDQVKKKIHTQNDTDQHKSSDDEKSDIQKKVRKIQLVDIFDLQNQNLSNLKTSSTSINADSNSQQNIPQFGPSLQTCDNNITPIQNTLSLNSKQLNQQQNPGKQNRLLKQRDYADIVKLTRHFFPYYYQSQPVLGITYKNQFNLLTINQEIKSVGLHKIEPTNILEESFIKYAGSISSKMFHRDIIFLQTMNDRLFVFDSKVHKLKLLLSDIEHFDYIKGGQDKIFIFAKREQEIIRYIFKIENNEMCQESLINTKVVCKIKQEIQNEFQKIIVFQCNIQKYISFVCKNQITIYKQDKNDQRYSHHYTINEPGILFSKQNPKRVTKNNQNYQVKLCFYFYLKFRDYNFLIDFFLNSYLFNNIICILIKFKIGEDTDYQIYAVTSKSLIMYSGNKNKHVKKNLLTSSENIQDFTVSYNPQKNLEYIIVAYSRSITLIVKMKDGQQEQVANLKVDTNSDIQKIWVFWVENIMQLAYQTISDSDLTSFHNEFFAL